MNRWRVHKFGGSSVKTADRMRKAAEIIGGERTARTAVVLSACGGVTDALLGLVAAAERQESFAAGLDQLRDRHLAMASALLDHVCSLAGLTPPRLKDPSSEKK